MPDYTVQPEDPPDQRSLNRKLLLVGIITVSFVILIILLFFQLFLQTKSSEVPSVEINKATPSATQATPSAQKEKTEDWKTYTNTFKNKTLSFKYPEDWTVSTNDVSEATDDIDHVISKGDHTITFFSSMGRGATMSRPGDIINQKYNQKTIQVKFDGKTVKATETIGKDENDGWEIFPEDVSGLTFAFDLYSSKVPSDADRSTMLSIAATFKFLD